MPNLRTYVLFLSITASNTASPGNTMISNSSACVYRLAHLKCVSCYYRFYTWDQAYVDDVDQPFSFLCLHLFCIFLEYESSCFYFKLHLNIILFLLLLTFILIYSMYVRIMKTIYIYLVENLRQRGPFVTVTRTLDL